MFAGICIVALTSVSALCLWEGFIFSASCFNYDAKLHYLYPSPSPYVPTERERQRAAKQTSDSSSKASLLSAFVLATEEKRVILEEFVSHLGSVLEVPR